MIIRTLTYRRCGGRCSRSIANDFGTTSGERMAGVGRFVAVRRVWILSAGRHTRATIDKSYSVLSKCLCDNHLYVLLYSNENGDRKFTHKYLLFPLVHVLVFPEWWTFCLYKYKTRQDNVDAKHQIGGQKIFSFQMV